MKKLSLFIILLLSSLLSIAQMQYTLKPDAGVGLSSSMFSVANDGLHKRILREPNLSASLLLGLKRKKSPISFWTGYKISSHHLSFKLLASIVMDPTQENFKKTVLHKYNAGHIPLYIGYHFIKNKAVAPQNKKDKKNKMEEPSKWSIFAEVGVQYTYILYTSYEGTHDTYPDQIVYQRRGPYRQTTEGVFDFGSHGGALTYHFGTNIAYQLNSKISFYTALDANFGNVAQTGGFYGANVFIPPSGVIQHPIGVFSTATYSALKLGILYNFQ